MAPPRNDRPAGATFGDLLRQAAEALRPPERLTVSQSAEKYRYVNNPGSYVGPWRNATTPYLVEPMDELASLDYRGWVFVSASQSGKTDSAINWLTYNVICEPSDMMIVEVSSARARDFSIRRVDRLHRASPDVGSRLWKTKTGDAVYSKRYVTGLMLNISWPSVTELSGRPIPRLFLTDYDRMPMDVEGEGSPFDLAQARTTTFGRNGMTAAESSPSYPVLDHNWVPSTPHEAPPCEGILSLYNRGDRRRWYWTCRNCKNPFEPTFKLLKWPEKSDPMECAENAWMECPHCSAKYKHVDKRAMNLRGRWLKDGEKLTKTGKVTGKPVNSEIASFWLHGVAAAFKDWQTIVWKYLVATEEYMRTGSESALQTTVNTDQSMPYTPRSHMSERLPEQMRSRARDFGHKVVPPGVLFLIASVDVQKSRFVVQVMGVGSGADIWVVDRFDIRYSNRPDEDMPGQMHRVHPFTYREDWRILLREVVLRSYELSDGSGRAMAIKATICDAGGMDRSTANAYEFWRWLKVGPTPEDADAADWPEWTPGLHSRFQLYRGTVTQVGYRVKMTYPDSGRQSKYAGARGEIPVLMTNVTPVKNHLDAILDRDEIRSGRINFPDWLDIGFYKELCVETKDLKGIWQNPRGLRNESWDLFVMALALLIEPRHVGVERIDWSDPPTWAAEWDDNDLVFLPEKETDPRRPEPLDLNDLAALGRNLA